MHSPVVLVSGASSGLGRAAAIHLSSRGFIVVGGGRRFPEPGLPFETIRLDVGDDNSVAAFVGEVRSRYGRIDALVNCAGVSLSGAVEAMSMESAKRIVDTNLFGTVRLCKAVIPQMRAQSAGRIVNVSSIAGVIGLPFNALYSASKFAVEGFTECLRHEVRRFNIHVSLLEPGDFLTAMTTQFAVCPSAAQDTVYFEAMRRALDVMEADSRRCASLRPFTLRLESILTRKRPKLRHSVGLPLQRFGALMHGVVPDALLERVLRMIYGIA